MIVYFTGTGNSRYAAQYLAAILDDKLVDAAKLIKAGESAKLRSEKPWVFVAPTYGWQLPHIFQDWLRAGDFRGSRNAYFVMTCGLGIGTADQKNEALCFEKAFRYLGTAKIVMPENYIAMFPAPDEAESEQIRQAAQPDLDAAAACIGDVQPLAEIRHGPLDSILTSLVNLFFTKKTVKADAFYATDACVACGKCVSACMLNNISLINQKPHWGSDCTHCMACICGCPTEAIEYGKKSRGKHRYQCPNYVKE